MTEFIFFHIEKCGGTSLRQAFYEYFIQIYSENMIFIPGKFVGMGTNYLPQHIENIKKNSKYDFPNIKVILSHIRFNSFPNLTKSCNFKFTCIREPIPRIISHYYFFHFPDNNIELIDLDQKNFEKFAINHGSHISSCLDITDESDINEIDKRLKEFNYISILENIEDNLVTLNELLNNKFGEKIVLNIKKTNVGKKKKYIKDYKKLKIILKKYCTLDKLIYNRIITLKSKNIIK